jgi:hypothetical protein
VLSSRKTGDFELYELNHPTAGLQEKFLIGLQVVHQRATSITETQM